jgi:hypothetical protein
MGNLLLLKPAHGKLEIETNQQACERNKSNGRQVVAPALENLCGNLVPLTEASRNALLIHEASHV